MGKKKAPDHAKQKHSIEKIMDEGIALRSVETTNPGFVGFAVSKSFIEG